MLGAIAAAMALSGCVSGPKVNNAPMAALDLSRYLGEWYEIARFDHSFERGAKRTWRTAARCHCPGWCRNVRRSMGRPHCLSASQFAALDSSSICPGLAWNFE